MVDNLITLHDPEETNFDNLGVGVLVDAVKCEVLEELNGAYVLTMEYPINGIRYKDINLRSIIQTKSDIYGNKQLFRICDISRPLDGIVTIDAQHISYDLTGYMMSPFEALGSSDLVSKLNTSSNKGRFMFTLRAQNQNEKIKIEKPCSIRSIIGGNEVSLLKTYGGEIEFNGWNVDIHTKRGSDNGVQILYGKNLTGLQLDESSADMYSHIYPFWYSEKDGYVEIEHESRCMTVNPEYKFKKCVPIDFSQLIEEKPSPTGLQVFVSEYIKNHPEMGVPTVSMDVSFELLSQFKEYENITLLEKVALGDIVHVEYSELNVNATARCMSVQYDAINDKYINLELGDVKQKLSDTIYDNGHVSDKFMSAIESAMQGIPTLSAVEEAIEAATEHINGGLGGYVILRDSRGGKKPDELLIMDTESPTTARNVWRFNKNGLGFSGSGYNGPYEVAMTSDGKINASMVTTGTLVASGAFTGSLNSSVGHIGGWTIGSTKLSNSDNTVGIATTATSFWAGSTPGESVADTAKFRVAYDGSMRAIKGNIGNMTLTDTYMYTGNMECGIGGNSWGMWSGGSGSAGSAKFRVERATGDVYGNFANFNQFKINNRVIVYQDDNKIVFYNGTKIVHFDVEVRPSPNVVCCTPVALPSSWQFASNTKPSIYTTPITQYPSTRVKGATPRDRTNIGFNLYLYRTDYDFTHVSCLLIGREW